MPSIAGDIAQWIKNHPEATPNEKEKLLNQIPTWQWALPGGYWNDLAPHCCNHVVIHEEPRFMNRLAIYRITPLPRCLYRAPDGRGLAWLKSGGPLEAYGRCEQRYCERANLLNP